MHNDKISILIIEDSPADARLIKEALAEGYGVAYNFKYAGRLSDGLKKISEEDFDLVLLDLSLPDSTGLETITSFSESKKDIPLIILTGTDNLDVAIEALNIGAQDYLVKGQFDGASLPRSIRYAIERKKIEVELKKSESRYQLLFEDAVDGIYITTVEGKYVDVNTGLAKMLGYKNKDELLSIDIKKELYVSEDERPGPDKRNRVFKTRLKKKDGAVIYAEISSRVIYEDGKPKYYQGIVRDITEQKNIEEKLKQQAEAMEAAIDGVAILDKEEKYIYLNKAHAKIYGYDNPLELTGKSWTILYGYDELRRFKNDIMPILKKNGYWRGEAIGMKKNGSKFFQELSLTTLSDGGLICVVHNIDESKKRENEIIYLGYHDKLTDLYNRRFVEEEIIRLDARRQLPISIVMGDLNSLKLANDTFGHNMGDMLLKEISKLLRRICRSDDILARWGGDEFVMLLPKTSSSDAEGVAVRIKKGCANLAVQKIPLSLAIGIATKTEENQDIDKIIIEAESNMYKNKLVEKESTSSSIIYALEQTLFEKSSETMEHALRIKDNALQLGKSVKLHSHQLDELTLLASLHDIGKVAIPETILLKKGKLTEKEWAVIKRHTEIGFNIISSSPQIGHIAKYVIACHENWDGSGYPKGLSREAIPIASRIILVCDAYDVMTNERSYKKAMSKNEAIKELKRCAGTQFDPVLAEKFVEILSTV